MCPAHYQRWRKGDSLAYPILKLEQHGLSKTPEHSSWKSMKARCYNKNNAEYYRYGGRGIKVCDRWLHSLPNFVADMGKRPDGMSLDRIDPYGNYEPSNCRWATAQQQNRNYRLVPRNKSGYHGVRKIVLKTCIRYNASIMVNNKKIHIGRYKTYEEAVNARKRAELKYWH